MLTATVNAIASNVGNQVSFEILNSGGVLATVSLIISLSLAFLLADSKWWGRWLSSTLGMSSSPLLVVFGAIVLFKILLVI